MNTPKETHLRYSLMLIMLGSIRTIRDSLLNETDIMQWDTEAIEYYLKKLAARKVPTSLSIKDCADEFLRRLRLLENGNSDEIQQLKDLIRENICLIEAEDLREFYLFFEERTPVEA